MNKENLNEKNNFFGLNCGNGLTWPGGSWIPGGEYIRQLKIQNVSNKVFYYNKYY